MKTSDWRGVRDEASPVDSLCSEEAAGRAVPKVTRGKRKKRAAKAKRKMIGKCMREGFCLFGLDNEES